MSVVVEAQQFGELYCPSCEAQYSEGKECPKDGARLVKVSLEPDPIIGRDLDGRFKVLEKLGEGGMGAVYRAHQHSVDREVAIKVVHAHLVSDPETIQRFLREAKLTSKLNHQNAVGVLDFGQTDDGVFYLVMELVPGRTLDHVLREEGVLAPARVIRIGLQICDALDTAHALQIVHRDLKPANIMLVESRRDSVKVLDFGLAKMLELQRELPPDEKTIKDTLATANAQPLVTTLLGTPAFLPPERSEHGLSDMRSDLYSLGCVLYLLASGTLPFQAPTPQELLAAHATRRPTPLANVPPSIAKVIDKLLQKNPDDRYQSAAETHAALEEAAELDGISAYQSSPSIEQARMSRQSMRISQPSIAVPVPVSGNRKLGLMIGVAATAVALLVIVIVWSSGRSESSPRADAPQTAPRIDPPDPTPHERTVAAPPQSADKPAEAKPVEVKPVEAKPDKPFDLRPDAFQVKKPPVRPTPGKPGKPKLPF